MDIHEAAIEERIAFAEEGDVLAAVEMFGDGAAALS